MAEADPTSSFKVPHAVENPERIPVKRYYSQEFFDAEAERLWTHVWQMACRTETIPNVGDWIEYEILGRSILVVHGKNGIKAFHNVCRHRGLPLNEGQSHGNCKGKGFICPFHGWRWNTEGENTFVYAKHLFSEEQLDAEDLKLAECRSHVWGGMVFINFDDDAPSFEETFASFMPGFDARHMDDLKAEWWYATELPANWKVGMEAFMEGYHVLRTHPQLHNVVPQLYNSRYGNETGGLGQTSNPHKSVAQNIEAQIKNMELLSTGMSGMVHAKEVEIMKAVPTDALPEDPEAAVQMWYGMVMGAITQALSARGEKVPNLLEVAQSHPVDAVEFMFPNLFFLPTFTSMSCYRIRPTGPETCIFELWSLTHMAESDNFEPVMEPTFLPYDSKEFPEIPQQDYSNIPQQQKGLHGGGFEFMRLSKNVEGMISNYNRIIDGYLKGADQSKLAEATQSLCGNFDGVIKDYDF